MKIKNETREIDLGKIRIKVVTDYFERADVETILSRCHPLGSKRAMAERLCYAAEYRGEWLAVLLFDGAVRRNKYREARIGWSGEQAQSRLKHVANNSRYLINPGYAGVRNLASKILSLVTERISEDWRKHYGIPVVAVETYVDPQHNDNEGSCYLAAGWERLGITTGYEAYNQERTHGKWYFLKGLHKDSFAALRSEIPHALLTGVKNVSGESNNNYVLDASKISIKDLQGALAHIQDPRGKQGQVYRFVPLLSLCLCAVLSGHTQYRQIADWIAALPAPDRVKFGLRGDRVPDEGTIGYLIRKIDPLQLQTVLQEWLLKTYKREVCFRKVSLDGKALRATSAEASEQDAFLNVFANELGITIEHLPTAKGGGEKKTARDFVESADVEGKIILADAIHTDSKFVAALEKKKAAYVLTVKDNQKSLKKQLIRILERTKKQFPELLRCAETIDKGHGRLEVRTISALSVEHTNLRFPGIKQIAKMTRTREILKYGKRSEEELYLITNIPYDKLDASGLMELKRSYWDIENKLHYRKDFVFGEDRSTIRAKHGPQNMSTLRNFALGLLLANGVGNVKRCVDNLKHHPCTFLKMAA